MMIVAYNHGGTIHYHKAGCADLNRASNKFHAFDAQSFPSMDEAIAEFLDTGDESNPGWIMEEMTFFPCTR